MTPPSPTPLFARKGNATPTPVPEDTAGFTGPISDGIDPPTGDGTGDETGTVVSFETNKPTGNGEQAGQAEAGSMLAIPLTPRQTPVTPPRETDADDDSVSVVAPASVSTIPLPDNKALVVIEDSDAADTPNLTTPKRQGFAGKPFAAVLFLTLIAVILATIYLNRSVIHSDSTQAGAIIPTAPAILTSPTAPIPPTTAQSKKKIAPPRKPVGLYSIQLGSLTSHANAQRELRTLKQRHGKILSGLDLRVVSGAVAGKGSVWRIRAVGLPSVESAERACRRLGSEIKSCLVLRPR